MSDEPVWTRALDYERVFHARIGRFEEESGIEWASDLPLAFTDGNGLYAMRGFEPVARLEDGRLDKRWHISINGAGHKDGARLPTWTEMTDCAHVLRPGVTFVVGIPPRSLWMAEIESGHFVLHLWQIKDENLEDSWAAQRTPGGRRPS